ncbi:MAG: hypothetical protein ACRC5C_05480 [Bacilli bacterium]
MTKNTKIILTVLASVIVLFGVGSTLLTKWATDNFDVYMVEVDKTDVADVLHVVTEVIDYGFDETDVAYVVDKIHKLADGEEKEVGSYDVAGKGEETMFTVDAVTVDDVTTLTFVTGKTLVSEITKAIDSAFEIED